MRKRIRKFLLHERWPLVSVLAICFCTFPCAFAAPVLGGLFSDHMVLQRDKPVHIFGRGEPGEAISVSLAEQTASTKTAATGYWSVFLKPMKAGGPFDLIVNGNNSIVFHDVLIGEVWVASGQSNMDYILARSEGSAAELPRSDLPWVRLLKVPRESALVVQDSMEAQWTLCTPATAHDFSAVAYYFARDLSHRLNVPVGVIQSSWPGSTGEEWTSYDTLQHTPELRPIVDRWLAAPATTKNFAKDGEPFSLQFDSFELLPASDAVAPVSFSNFDRRLAETRGGGVWSTSSPGQLSLIAPGAERSVYAADFSGILNLKSSPSLRASFPRLKDEDLSAYSGIRFQVRGSGCFHTHLEEPAISDGDYYSSPRMCASNEWTRVAIPFKNYKQEGWGVVNPLHLQDIQAFVIDEETSALHANDRPPAGIYDGMIAPITGYTICGVLWYQGEGNSGRAFQYRSLLPALIHDWRAVWREGDFPFLIVQLPNLGTPTLNVEKNGWAELREAQSLASRQIPNTGLVVTLDLGAAHNLHPPRKAEIGERLTLLALGKVYRANLEFSGPVLERSQFEGAEVHLEFSHAAGLRARGGTDVQGFSVAGVDQKFLPATAKISGTVVTVASPLVPHPVAVRYAWAGNPICNLINATGLPAEPFRTDTWPDVTENAK